jgi:predicted house-cleaning NTP pyrophosphatase (Maf/HAM1 superfamily)
LVCGLKIVLASSSPRRIELMKTLGLEFTHTPPKVEEDETLTDPVERVERNSLLKAQSVQKDDLLVIGLHGSFNCWLSLWKDTDKTCNHRGLVQ